MPSTPVVTPSLRARAPRLAGRGFTGLFATAFASASLVGHAGLLALGWMLPPVLRSLEATLSSAAVEEGTGDEAARSIADAAGELGGIAPWWVASLAVALLTAGVAIVAGLGAVQLSRGAARLLRWTLLVEAARALAWTAVVFGALSGRWEAVLGHARAANVTSLAEHVPEFEEWIDRAQAFGQMARVSPAVHLVLTLVVWWLVGRTVRPAASAETGSRAPTGAGL